MADPQQLVGVERTAVEIGMDQLADQADAGHCRGRVDGVWK